MYYYIVVCLNNAFVDDSSFMYGGDMSKTLYFRENNNLPFVVSSYHNLFMNF